MKILFEIKESLSDIVSEILHSDRWRASVIGEDSGLRRVIIKDPYYDSEASIDIWEHEIHIRTAWSNYSYRIYEESNTVWSEYIGAYRGLLEQKLLPKITPKGNLLDSEVLQSSLLEKEKETLRTYGMENAKHKRTQHGQLGSEKEQYDSLEDHPKVVQDEFIKIGVPLPPPQK